MTYRGGGPPEGTFDFTPAFFDGNCARGDAPAALRTKCGDLRRAYRTSGFAFKIDCLAEPRRAECRALLADAEAAKASDAVLLAACRASGQARFNAVHAPTERRAQGCYYSRAKLGGPNRRGLTWQKLMPAACRPGSYVGRDATDCCIGSVYVAAALARECSGFFVPAAPPKRPRA